MCLLFLLLLIGAFFLVRKGRPDGVGPPWMNRAEPPEAEARRVLSERFARGDISSDEFLERASVLNWTPGAEDPGDGGRRKRR